MGRPWFSCEPVDASFFETAPVRLVGRFRVPRPAADVWAELTGERPLSWCRILDEVRWTSPRPFGVGTTREVNAVRGTNVLREHYFRWEEGRQHSFYVAEASTPLARRFAEDYLVEPTGEGSCLFTWRICFEPRLLAAPAVPLNRLLLRTLFTDTRDHYGLR
ncbi:MAG: SRPBCC family protein [Actinobacteria bacterium]|nr:SRPBCC family protein [Actinomycetota bacterium]